MSTLLQVGTDAALLCLFDPECLPPSFDAADADDPLEVLRSLQAQGRIWLNSEDLGGISTALILVNEGTPCELASRTTVIDCVEQFHLSGELLWFC